MARRATTPTLEESDDDSDSDGGYGMGSPTPTPRSLTPPCPDPAPEVVKREPPSQPEADLRARGCAWRASSEGSVTEASSSESGDPARSRSPSPAPARDRRAAPAKRGSSYYSGGSCTETDEGSRPSPQAPAIYGRMPPRGHCKRARRTPPTAWSRDFDQGEFFADACGRGDLDQVWPR